MRAVPAGAHPGSAGAYQLGCSCPIDANHGGAGMQETIKKQRLTAKDKSFVQTFWFIDPGCKLHTSPYTPPGKK